MNPIIGITPSMEGGKVFLHRSYADAVIRAGGIPLVIPFVTEPDTIRQIASCLDGLLLSGGEDIDPAYFDEEPLPGLGDVCPERDQSEVTLCQYFMKIDKPIFAICRGCQILNVAAGGDIYQDLFTQRQGLIQHIQRAPKSHASHQVQVVEGTQLHRMIGAKSYRVNSFHHQAVRRIAPPFVISATATDGVIEAFESKEHAFIIGVQWHPEGMAQEESISQGLFDSFVRACRTVRK